MRESADVMHTALPILAPLPVLWTLLVMVGEGPPSTAPDKRVGQGGAAMFASAEKHSHG
jgi:hypothetical protein